MSVVKNVIPRKSIQQVDRMVPVAEGTVYITKRGTAWSLQLTSTNASSSLDCEEGWKNRRGEVGRGSRQGPGSITPETEAILDMFLELESVVYVNIVSQSFLEFSFDRPARPNDTLESDIVRIIERLLGWNVAYVENDFTQSRGYIVADFRAQR